MAGNKFRGKTCQEEKFKFNKNQKYVTLSNLKILSKPLDNKKYRTGIEIKKGQILLDIYDILNQRDGTYAKILTQKSKKFTYVKITDDKGNIFKEKFKEQNKNIELKKHSYTTIGEIRLNDIKNNELELMQSNPEYKKTQLFIKESSKIIEQKLNSQNIQNLMKEIEQNEIDNKNTQFKSFLFDLGFCLDAICNPLSQVKCFIQSVVGRDLITWIKLDTKERLVNLVNSCGIKKIKSSLNAMDIFGEFILNKFWNKKDEDKNNKFLNLDGKTLDYYNFSIYLRNKNELSLEFKEILEKHKELEDEFKKSENKEEILIKYINIIY